MTKPTQLSNEQLAHVAGGYRAAKSHAPLGWKDRWTRPSGWSGPPWAVPEFLLAR